VGEHELPEGIVWLARQNYQDCDEPDDPGDQANALIGGCDDRLQWQGGEEGQKGRRDDDHQVETGNGRQLGPLRSGCVVDGRR
jgi:hypothetical protein